MLNINRGEEFVSVELYRGQGLLLRVHMARMASRRSADKFVFLFFKWQRSRCDSSQKYPRLRPRQQPHANVLIRVRMWQASLLLTGARRVWDSSLGGCSECCTWLNTWSKWTTEFLGLWDDGAQAGKDN